MHRFNRFIYGFVIGILLPPFFLWLFTNRFYPAAIDFADLIRQLFPSIMLGKLLLLSIMPNLVGVFIFYKQNNFKPGIGMMIGSLPYLATAMFML